MDAGVLSSLLFWSTILMSIFAGVVFLNGMRMIVVRGRNDQDSGHVSMKRTYTGFSFCFLAVVVGLLALGLLLPGNDRQTSIARILLSAIALLFVLLIFTSNRRATDLGRTARNSYSAGWTIMVPAVVSLVLIPPTILLFTGQISYVLIAAELAIALLCIGVFLLAKWRMLAITRSEGDPGRKRAIAVWMLWFVFVFSILGAVGVVFMVIGAIYRLMGQ